MIPVAVHIALLSLYAVLFIIIFMLNSRDRKDLDDVRLGAIFQEHSLNGLTRRVAQLERDHHSLISKPADGTRVAGQRDTGETTITIGVKHD